MKNSQKTKSILNSTIKGDIMQETIEDKIKEAFIDLPSILPPKIPKEEDRVLEDFYAKYELPMDYYID